MTAAAARAPTPLRAGTFRSIANLVGSTLVEVPRSQGRVMGAGKIDVAFLPSGPLKLVAALERPLGTDMHALEDLKIGVRRKIV